VTWYACMSASVFFDSLLVVVRVSSYSSRCFLSTYITEFSTFCSNCCFCDGVGSSGVCPCNLRPSFLQIRGRFLYFFERGCSYCFNRFEFDIR